MGMAASQARMLELTARKSNIQFQGQQINQQRTTLANESSSYNSQLLDLTVPTAPSSADYTKTTYTFNANAQTCTVASFEYDNTNSAYTVNYTYDTKADKAASASAVYAPIDTVVSSTTDTYTRTAAGFTANYVDSNSTPPSGTAALSATVDSDISMLNSIFGANYDSNSTYYKYTTQSGEVRYIAGASVSGLAVGDTSAAGGVTNYTATRNGYRTAAGTILEMVDYAEGTQDEKAETAVDKSNLQLIFGDNYQSDDTYYKYTVNGIIRYIKASNLQSEASGSNIPYYYVDQDADVTNTGKINDALVQWNDSGRATSVSFKDSNGDTIEYPLSTTTSTDEEAYNDAMNQYEYDKYSYEQAMNNINAKLDTVQAQDKRLEIQLTQLDTEQSAVSTEVDAVKKVIDKDTESSFKTFA